MKKKGLFKKDIISLVMIGIFLCMSSIVVLYMSSVSYDNYMKSYCNIIETTLKNKLRDAFDVSNKLQKELYTLQQHAYMYNLYNNNNKSFKNSKSMRESYIELLNDVSNLQSIVVTTRDCELIVLVNNRTYNVFSIYPTVSAKECSIKNINTNYKLIRSLNHNKIYGRTMIPFSKYKYMMYVYLDLTHTINDVLSYYNVMSGAHIDGYIIDNTRYQDIQLEPLVSKLEYKYFNIQYIRQIKVSHKNSDISYLLTYVIPTPFLQIIFLIIFIFVLLLSMILFFVIMSFTMHKREKYIIAHTTIIEQANKLDKLRTAIETIDVGIVLLDTSFRIIYVNAAQLRMHEYTDVSDVLDKTIDIFSCDNEDFKNVYISQHYESCNKTKFGKKIPVDIMSSSIYSKNNVFLGRVYVYTNITKQKTIEKELYEQKEMYKTLATQIKTFLERQTV